MERKFSQSRSKRRQGRKRRICKKCGRVVQKSMFGGLEAGPEVEKLEKKRDREKEEEGREAKIGTRGLKMDQKSRKRGSRRSTPISDGTSGRHFSSPDGRGKGPILTCQGKSSPPWR